MPSTPTLSSSSSSPSSPPSSSSQQPQQSWLLKTNKTLLSHPTFTTLLTTTLLKYIQTYITPHLPHPTRRQICFHVLGSDLVSELYTKGGVWKDEPWILMHPYLTSNEKEKMVISFRREMVDSVIMQASNDGFHMQDSVVGFKEQIQKAYVDDIERFKETNANGHRLSIFEEIGVALSSLLDGSAYPLPLNGVNKNILDYFSSSNSNSSSIAKDSNTSNTNMNTYTKIFTAVQGTILPSSLQRYLYTTHLTPPSTSTNIHSLLTNAAAEKGITDPFVTDKNFVIQHYMKTAISDSLLVSSHDGGWVERVCEVGAKVLNVHYTICGRTSLSLGYLLVPLLIEFYDDDDDDDSSVNDEDDGDGDGVGIVYRGKDRNVYYIAGLFEELIKAKTQPAGEMVGAAQAMLFTLDPSLHAHLMKTFSNHAKSTKRLHHDDSDSANTGYFNNNNNNNNTNGMKHLETLLTSILTMNFVSLIPSDTPLNFIWNHCLLHGFNSTIPSLFCVDILILQRTRLLRGFYKGGVGECLSFLQRYKYDMLTRDLMGRYRYYNENKLIGDFDLSMFERDTEGGSGGSGGGSGSDGMVYSRMDVKKLQRLHTFKESDSGKPKYFSKMSSRSILENDDDDNTYNDYNPDVVQTIVEIIDTIESASSATTLQSRTRGILDRTQLSDPMFFVKRRKAILFSAQAKAIVLLRRFVANAIARRRVKTAKAERIEVLRMLGRDDSMKEIFDRTFDMNVEGVGLGLNFRDASDETIDRAVRLKAVDKKDTEDTTNKFCEVSTVKEGGQGEKAAIAAGDLLLLINDVRALKKSELKNIIEDAKVNAKKKNDGKVVCRFMKGVRVRAGNITSLV